MVLNPATLARKSPVLCRLVGLSRSPSSYFGQRTRLSLNPVSRIGPSGARACRFHSLSYGHVGEVGNLRQCGMGFRQLGFDRFRVLAVSGGGSGGSSGIGGNAGGGGGRSEGDSSGAAGDGGNDGSFLGWYMNLLSKYPVVTKAVTSALLTLAGDLICQLAIDQVESLDLKRTFLFTFLGLVLVGPTLHFWYLYLSKLIPLPGASGAFVRLLLDQFIFAPIFIGVFLSTLVTLEGRPSDVVPKLQQEWFSAVVANWKLWIPFQFLNFRFVPQQFQVLAANAIALVWNVILSFKAHKEILQK